LRKAGQIFEYPDLTPGLGVAVYEALDVLSCHEARPLSPAVGHVSFGVLFAPGDEIPAVVDGEAVLQRPDRGREAVLLGVEDYREAGFVFGGGRGDEARTRHRRRPRLDAGGERAGEEQLVGDQKFYLTVLGGDGDIVCGDQLAELRVRGGRPRHETRDPGH